jgi:hypothetical protein
MVDSLLSSVSLVTLEETCSCGVLRDLDGEFRDTVDAYLKNLAASEMRSLADIIQFNKDHPELQAGISKCLESI